MTTPKSNPSKHYKHFRKAVAFRFRKLELCRHCRFRAGSFSGLSPRIQVLAHMPCWPSWSFYPKTVEITCAKWNAYKQSIQVLASYKSSKRTHFKAKLDTKGQFFKKNLLLNYFSYVPWEQKNMILNLEESVNFFAIWPAIAPYPI
jgi:hypothetical protein